MTEIKDILKPAETVINKYLKQELIDQGHHHTGAAEESFHSETVSKGKAEVMHGYAIHYTQFLNDGFPAESASMSQFPFLLEYFTSKGFPVFSAQGNVTAAQMAAMTIKKWMREGMPTQASKRYSKTGSRTGLVESAFLAGGVEIDEQVGIGMDHVVEEYFQKEKSGKV